MRTAGEPLLVVVSPAARAVDGESVRVARDVLSAAAPVKVAFPTDAADLDRVLSHRGRRRPVVIGDDRALRQVVRALHRQRALGDEPIGMVPVGRGESVTVSRGLGVPGMAVDAARAVVRGLPRGLDLLTDDSGGVVLGALRIPGDCRKVDGEESEGEVCSPQANTSASSRRDEATVRLLDVLTRTARTVARGGRQPSCPRLRVEADGKLLTDLDRPLRLVSVRPTREKDGYAEVLIRGEGPLRLLAREIRVTGPDFDYTADGTRVGPVRARTWTVVPRGWALTLPG